MNAVPSYEPDIYSDAAILDPYPHYAAMRDLGPLVYLPLYDVYAIPRYAELKKALLAHNDFVSGHGVAGFTWPEMFQVKNALASDEPDHSRLRQVMGAPLAPSALGPLAEQIESAADALIVRLTVSIVSSLVGLPENGRDRMLDWAAASFDMLGVGNDRGKQAFEIAGEMINYVMTECNPDTVKPGGWAAQIWSAVQTGKLTPMEAGILHIDILAPSLDTTIFATGHLLNQLATNPDQWTKLKADPSLIPAAIDEVVRLESPIRAFGRVVDEAQEVGGLTLPAGARVLMMYASANRDERKWGAAESYNIERTGLVGHLGFGHGRHVCVGMHLARLEMRALLKAIVARVDRIEVGEPVLQLNNVLRGFARLPARFVAN
jgi:cytochrome P450